MASGLEAVSDAHLKRIALFAHEQMSQPLSDAQARAMTIRLMDALACAAAARASHDAARLRAMPGMAEPPDGAPACTLIGGGRATLDGAAFLNACLIRQLDWNDTYIGKNGGHPSDFFAGVLAAGEHAGRSGHDVLRALAIGNHVMLDLCDAASAISRGWDPSTYVALAGTVAMAAALGLTPAQTAHALAMTAVSGPMLLGRVGKVSSWKGLASAVAVRNSLFDALLAQADMTGPDPAFEGDYGFVKHISGPLELELDPRRDRTGDSHLKFYPAVYHAQGPLELCLRLNDELVAALGPDAASRIEAIDIDIYEFALRFTADTPDKWAPENVETADHSIPFMSAHALTRGEFGLHSVHDSLRDETVRALTKRVRVTADPAFTARWPAQASSRVTVEADGRRFVAETAAAIGHPSRPLGLDDVRAKFLACAGRGVDEALAQEWARRVETCVEALTIAPVLDPAQRLG